MFHKESKIINTDHLNSELRQVCEFQHKSKWELLFRGSENNFDWEEFHSKCDNISPTLVIVKSVDGCIFGGYTKAKWNSPEDRLYKWMADSDAFVFRLLTPNLESRKYRCVKSRRALFCTESFGPCFGSFDLEFDNEGHVISTLNSDISDSKASSSNFGVPFKSRELQISEITEVEVFYEL